MYNYDFKITEFLKENFTPADDNTANVKHTTDSLMSFLFRVFPEGCISDYELSDILEEQGYRRTTFVRESTTSRTNDEGKEFFEIEKSLAVGWCMRTHHDLSIEVIKPPEL